MSAISVEIDERLVEQIAERAAAFVAEVPSPRDISMSPEQRSFSPAPPAGYTHWSAPGASPTIATDRGCCSTGPNCGTSSCLAGRGVPERGSAVSKQGGRGYLPARLRGWSRPRPRGFTSAAAATSRSGDTAVASTRAFTGPSRRLVRRKGKGSREKAGQPRSCASRSTLRNGSRPTQDGPHGGWPRAVGTLPAIRHRSGPVELAGLEAGEIESADVRGLYGELRTRRSPLQGCAAFGRHCRRCSRPRSRTG